LALATEFDIADVRTVIDAGEKGDHEAHDQTFVSVNRVMQGGRLSNMGS
jgi:hypothetical protein